MTDAVEAPINAPKHSFMQRVLLWLLIATSGLCFVFSMAMFMMSWSSTSFLGGAPVIYWLFAPFVMFSPTLMWVGLLCIPSGVAMLVAVGWTLARKDKRGWLGVGALIAMSIGGLLLFFSGLFGLGTEAAHNGSVTYSGHMYHLLVQTTPAILGADQYFYIYECDANGILCHTVVKDHAQYGPGQTVKPTDSYRLVVEDGSLVVPGDYRTYASYTPAP